MTFFLFGDRPRHDCKYILGNRPLHDCQRAMWPSEAHEFDTPVLMHLEFDLLGKCFVPIQKTISPHAMTAKVLISEKNKPTVSLSSP